MRKLSSGFPTRYDTNRAVQSLNMARDLKCLLQKVEGLYHPCSENKGTDLRLCFRIYNQRNNGIVNAHLVTWHS